MTIATTLVLAVINIKKILKKHGLADRVDYAMFFINSFALVSYVISILVWYSFYYYYSTTYFNPNKSTAEKAQARKISMMAWLASNFFSLLAQIAMFVILNGFVKS